MKNKVKLLDVSCDIADLGEYVGVCKDAEEKATFHEEIQACTTRVLNCLKLRHDSVFEFLDFVWKIECPIFVARQLMRYRNGVFLERSLRSCEPLPYEIEDSLLDQYYKEAYEDGVERYNNLVKIGFPKEVARGVLPVCSPTRFVWKLSFRSMMNVFNQRLSLEAQPHTRDVVEKMFKLASDWKEVSNTNIDKLVPAWCERDGRADNGYKA